MFCKYCGHEISTGSQFCKNCGKEVPRISARKRVGQWFRENLKAIVGVVIFVLILAALDSFSTESPTPPQQLSETSETRQIASYSQDEIAKSVVNIFCPSTRPDEGVTGGSGTIVTDDGLILTNSHVIPQDETTLFVSELGCLVFLPDPTTGQSKDAYLAHPVVIAGPSDDYDLAFMKIYAAVYNEKKGEYAGVYPRTFPTYQCENENVQLGEPVRVFGYPAISGGYSLTITEGVVSSFPYDGIIMTSAKISHGNSGGMAVDKQGCMIGVPSSVITDENESLGVIISTRLILNFLGGVQEALR